MTISDDQFDFVIVGGGTSGLAVAARLSEDPNVQVCVLEAGKSRLGDPNVDMPTGVGKMLNNPEYDWAFRSVPQVSSSFFQVFQRNNDGLAINVFPMHRRVQEIEYFIFLAERCLVAVAQSTL